MKTFLFRSAFAFLFLLSATTTPTILTASIEDEGAFTPVSYDSAGIRTHIRTDLTYLEHLVHKSDRPVVKRLEEFKMREAQFNTFLDGLKTVSAEDQLLIDGARAQMKELRSQLNSQRPLWRRMLGSTAFKVGGLATGAVVSVLLVAYLKARADRAKSDKLFSGEGWVGEGDSQGRRGKVYRGSGEELFLGRESGEGSSRGRGNGGSLLGDGGIKSFYHDDDDTSGIDKESESHLRSRNDGTAQPYRYSYKVDDPQVRKERFDKIWKLTRGTGNTLLNAYYNAEAMREGKELKPTTIHMAIFLNLTSGDVVPESLYILHTLEGHFGQGGMLNRFPQWIDDRAKHYSKMRQAYVDTAVDNERLKERNLKEMMLDKDYLTAVKQQGKDPLPLMKVQLENAKKAAVVEKEEIQRRGEGEIKWRLELGAEIKKIHEETLKKFRKEFPGLREDLKKIEESEYRDDFLKALEELSKQPGEFDYYGMGYKAIVPNNLTNEELMKKLADKADDTLWHMEKALEKFKIYSSRMEIRSKGRKGPMTDEARNSYATLAKEVYDIMQTTDDYYDLADELSEDYDDLFKQKDDWKLSLDAYILKYEKDPTYSMEKLKVGYAKWLEVKAEEE